MSNEKWDKTILNAILESKNSLVALGLSIFLSLIFVVCMIREISFGSVFADFAYLIETNSYLVSHEILTFMITLSVFHIFKENRMLIGRFQDKKEMMDHHLKMNLKVTFLFLIMTLLFSLTMILFFDFTSFKNIYIEYAHCFSIPYVCYTTIRYILFSLAISTINTLLLYKINIKLVTIINVVHNCLLFVWAYFFPIVYLPEFGYLPILMLNVCSPYGYANLWVDISYTVIYFFLLCMIIKVIQKLILSKLKDVIQ